MARLRRASNPSPNSENPLEYLPCSNIAEYRKLQVIYNPNDPCTSIYLILEGRVKVSRLAERGRQVLVNIYRTHEFFGESAFLHLSQRPEFATALENTKLMTWAEPEVEDLVLRQPRLGIAFAEMLARRATEFLERIESFSADTIDRRLARCLIRLAKRMGAPEADGSVRMPHFTHELLSEDVGTSRERVSHYMNQFRREGYLQYSRQGMVLYRDPFDNWLGHLSENLAKP